MLILARKAKQAVRIGDDIIVEVVSVQGDQVRLGITAPRRVPVWRQELYAAVSAENVQAAQTRQGLDNGALQRLKDQAKMLEINGKSEHEPDN